MAYWLFKSEPTTFSIDDLKRCPKQITHWDGVRNFQVRNLLRDQMKVGDQAFFYHSNCNPPGIVGSMEIVHAGYPDHTAWDKQSKHVDPRASLSNPIWYMVDVHYMNTFPRMVTLEELKQHPLLKKMKVASKENRLSITPVTSLEWEIIHQLIGESK